MGGGKFGGIANDMYYNDVGKGVVYVYEAYEAKLRVAACRLPVCFMNFWTDSLQTLLLYISILLTLSQTIHTAGNPHPVGDRHRPEDTHEALPQCVGVPGRRTRQLRVSPSSGRPPVETRTSSCVPARERGPEPAQTAAQLHADDGGPRPGPDPSTAPPPQPFPPTTIGCRKG